MRAKKVYENINFERGRNPKEAMDIGILNAAKSAMEKMGYRYSGANSLLKWAAEFNKPEYIDLAMNVGADITMDLGHSIEIAAVAGNPEAIEALLKNGAQPDWVSDYTYKWILPSWRNKTKLSPEVQDRYTRSLEFLKAHPNFTP